MAEEVRFFLRGLVYLVPLTLVYWMIGDEPAGTALLVALVVGFAAVIGLVLLHAPSAASELGPGSGGIGSRLLGAVNRALGFHEPVDAPPPLEGGPEVVPTGSPWPVIAAASVVMAGLGLIFGTWLLLPGLALLAWALLGWLTQLDRA